MLAKASRGFLYYVCRLGVTGERVSLPAGLRAQVASLKAVSPAPVCIGFGISTPQQARQAAAFGDGVIVGSHLVRLIEAHGRQARPGRCRRRARVLARGRARGAAAEPWRRWFPSLADLPASLGDHLHELRRRLVWPLVTIGIVFIVAFCFSDILKVAMLLPLRKAAVIAGEKVFMTVGLVHSHDQFAAFVNGTFNQVLAGVLQR